MMKNILILFLVTVIQLSAASKEKIQNKIESLLKSLPGSTRVGILVYNPITEDTIFAQNAALPMIPASNTKLFTTATALSLMGGDSYVSVQFKTNDPDITDGVINGNLYIKGYGNSVFTSKDMDTVIFQLKNMGIKKITGYIAGDDTYFDDIYTRDDWIENERANVKLPAISAIVLDRNRIVMHRRRRGRLRRYHIDVSNPPLHAAQVLKQKLINNGIKVEKGAISDKTPKSAVTLTESKTVLRDLIKRINKHSDNFLAECLFKTIGAVFSGQQGNSFYSTQAVQDFIKYNGIYSKGSEIVDGSGISRFDQITPGAIVGLLSKMYFDIVNFDDYYNSLSIAGVDGTLRHRMNGTDAEENFHGKTGTLNGVSALSGYLTTVNGDDIIVSILVDFDKGSWDYYKGIEDEIVETLAELE